MTVETIIAISSLVTVSAAGLALIIKQLEQSRCTTINCLCFKCHRKVPKEDKNIDDLEMQEVNNRV